MSQPSFRIGFPQPLCEAGGAEMMLMSRRLGFRLSHDDLGSRRQLGHMRWGQENLPLALGASPPHAGADPPT